MRNNIAGVITEAGSKSRSILIYATHPSPDLPKSEESFGNLQSYFFLVVSITKNGSTGAMLEVVLTMDTSNASLEVSIGRTSSAE